MPNGYVIFTESVHDQEALARYGAEATPSVIAAGGRLLTAGPAHEVVEGEWHGDTTVVLEFDTLQAATAWYHGDAYQAVAGGRHAAAISNVAIFEGFDPGPA